MLFCLAVSTSIFAQLHMWTFRAFSPSSPGSHPAAIRRPALRCGLDLLQLLYVQVLSQARGFNARAPARDLIASPCCSQALWVASGRVFASLAPGPGMASAAAVSALDPEPRSSSQRSVSLPGLQKRGCSIAHPPQYRILSPSPSGFSKAR